MPDKPELLRVEHLKKYFSVKGKMSTGSKKTLKAVDDVTLTVGQGEVVGLVGESGCGKSTLGRTIIRLYNVTDGSIVFRGQHIEKYGFHEMQPLRREMQMVFQDPFASLNPRMTVEKTVGASLKMFHIETPSGRRQAVAEMLEKVGLNETFLDKLPHEMSGGQRQRVAIARAMISDPSFVVCDEPVSALDVSVRAQVLNLMKDIQQSTGTSYLFISHDLSTVRYICDRIAVMYLGHIVEVAGAYELFDHPKHPYTQALLSAIPVPEVGRHRQRILLQGDLPSPVDPPAGCPFRTRCPNAGPECAEAMPELKDVGGGHCIACFRSEVSVPANKE